MTWAAFISLGDLGEIPISRKTVSDIAREAGLRAQARIRDLRASGQI
jgi:hypothetical protein